MTRKFLAAILGWSLLALMGCSASAAVAEPLKDARLRATPLHFGMKVSPDPALNPITPPERFEGYHVGEDFEAGVHELNAEVSVFALCRGKILYSGFAEGYGGLVVQRCVLDTQDVTVIYGHLTIAGLPKVGKTLSAGNKIGSLAPAHSHDSDGNRKHLHLGIHKGRAVVTLGYVQTEAELEQFLDPAQFIPMPSDLLQAPIAPYWKTGTGSST
jgi:hypothetical protein